MASSSNNFYYHYEANNDDSFDQYYQEQFQNQLDAIEEDIPAERKKRTYIERDREEGHKRLWNDYFSDNPTYTENLFRRRFRMNKSLFMRIVNRLAAEVPYFQQKKDATFQNGISPLQQCIAAIRLLAYGGAADGVDEYIRIGETTTRKCLEHFVVVIVDLFGNEYLHRPTPEDLERLLFYGEQRGFPGMVGSIDCTSNDLNVLAQSPVFNNIIYGRGPEVKYHVNGREYNLAFYLTDGIYPEWAIFVKSIPQPQNRNHSLFAERQEGARKDVERAFGVLQSRFAIIKNSCLILDKGKIAYIMRACLILHNMIVEDERHLYTLYNKDEFERDEIHTFSVNMPSNLESLGDGHTRIEDRQSHHQLKEDLIENIWNKFGHDE